MMNFIAQSMRRMGLAPSNKVTPASPNAAGDSIGGKAPLAHMDISSKWSYSSLEYPMDIQSKSDMGHYMMFYVNVAENTSYSRHNSMGAKETTHPQYGQSTPTQNDQQKAILDGTGFSKKQKGSTPDDTGNSWKPGYQPKVIKRKAHQGTSSDLMGIKRTMRTNDAIILYMPAQVLTNYTATYNDSELGANFGEAAGRISRADVSTVGGMTELVKGFAAQGADAMERAGAAMIGGLTGSDLMAARDKLSNRAQNNFLEATFKGIGFRKFSFQWKFTPKNPKEMKQVEKIIKTFKFHMLPEIPNDNRFGRYYTTPAEFDLFYMFRGDENSWINKIHTCVLLNMEVNYAPNGYQTFRPISGRPGAPPSEIDMKLDFQETKLITKADVNEGF